MIRERNAQKKVHFLVMFAVHSKQKLFFRRVINYEKFKKNDCKASSSNSFDD